MTRVSKRKIKKEDFEKIYRQLINILTKTNSKNDSDQFLKEFFSTTERIMFAKRLAIIFMIMEKIPDRKIADILSVSTSTIGRFIDKYTKGDYSYISSLIHKNEGGFWDFLGVLLFAGLNMPSRVGKDRYKWFENAEKKYSKFKQDSKNKEYPVS